MPVCATCAVESYSVDEPERAQSVTSLHVTTHPVLASHRRHPLTLRAKGKAVSRHRCPKRRSEIAQNAIIRDPSAAGARGRAAGFAEVFAMTPESGGVLLPPAQTGRPRKDWRRVGPDEPVRVEVRIPASLAAQLYSQARERGCSVSHTAAELIGLALDRTGGDEPTS